jgi:hypothetical protein
MGLPRSFADETYNSPELRAVQKKIGNIAFNTVTGNYTLVAEDEQKAIEVNSATDCTITVPGNGLVPFPVGTNIPVIWFGVGRPTIVPGSGVTIHSDGDDNILPSRYKPAALVKRATNEWYLWGIGDTGTTSGGAGDVTPPTVVSRIIANATPTKLRITYNEALLTSSVPVNSNFILNEGAPGAGFTGTPVVSGSYVELTLSVAATAGQAFDLGYTGTAIKDLAGNSAGTYATQTVTNNVAGGSGLVDLIPTGTGITETSTKVWHSAATDNNWVHQAKDNTKSLAGVGGIQIKYPAGTETDGSSNRETFFGLHTSNVLAGGYGSTPLMAASVRIHDASVLEWGLAGTRTDMGSPAVVDRYYRLYRDSGNDVYLQESTTGLPGSWGNLQLVGNITGTLYAVFDFFGNASKGFITEPKGEGFA